MKSNRTIVTTSYIPEGNPGTRITLQVMARLARRAITLPWFAEFALQFSNASSADSYLRPFFHYLDEDVETLYAPEFNLIHLLEHGNLIGDCDDIAMFYAAIFKAIGIERIRFVAMRTRKGDPDFYHVVVEAFEDGRWKRFDSTVKPSLVQIDYGQMVEYV